VWATSKGHSGVDREQLGSMSSDLKSSSARGVLRGCESWSRCRWGWPEVELFGWAV
jgi:hypothetical protein